MNRGETSPTLVLDIGSGLTCSSPLYSASNTNVVHVDILRKCQHQEIQGTIYKLPFPDKTFDAVYLSHVLEHLEFPLYALDEIKRVCKKFVVIRVPNELFTNAVLTDERSTEHLYCWTTWTLKRLLERRFSNVTIRSVHTIGRRTERNVLKRKLLTLKTYIDALLFTRGIENEIVAYCMVKHETCKMNVPCQFCPQKWTCPQSDP